jgi:hypothetical protein
MVVMNDRLGAPAFLLSVLFLVGAGCDGSGPPGGGANDAHLHPGTSADPDGGEVPDAGELPDGGELPDAGGGADGGQQGWSCSDWDALASQTFENEWWGKRTMCAQDSECVLDNRDVECPSGSKFRFSLIGRHVSDKAVFDHAFQASVDAVCKPGSENCMSSSLPLDFVAICQNGFCFADPRFDSVDAGP